MKNQSVVQHLLGFNEVFDQISRIYLRLPQKYRIYIGSDKTWIGGKEDGSSYLHLERISANAFELNRPLAEGDLDIQVYPQGAGYELAEGVMNQKVTCTLRGEKLSGLWLRVSFDETHHYLILLAGRTPEMYTELRHAGLTIARMIRNQRPKSAQNHESEKIALVV